MARRSGPASVPDPEPQPGDDLGAAAAAGLASADPAIDTEHGQSTFQPVWRARFLGVSYDSPSDDRPKMDEVRSFIVEGIVAKESRERRKDGELREVVSFNVTDVRPAPEGV